MFKDGSLYGSVSFYCFDAAKIFVTVNLYKKKNRFFNKSK